MKLTDIQRNGFYVAKVNRAMSVVRVREIDEYNHQVVFENVKTGRIIRGHFTRLRCPVHPQHVSQAAEYVVMGQWFVLCANCGRILHFNPEVGRYCHEDGVEDCPKAKAFVVRC